MHRTPQPPVSREWTVGLGYLLPGRLSQASLPWTSGDWASSAGGPLQDPACFSVPLAASSSPLMRWWQLCRHQLRGPAWSPEGPSTHCPDTAEKSLPVSKVAWNRPRERGSH